MNEPTSDALPPPGRDLPPPMIQDHAAFPRFRPLGARPDYTAWIFWLLAGLVIVSLLGWLLL